MLGKFGSLFCPYFSLSTHTGHGSYVSSECFLCELHIVNWIKFVECSPLGPFVPAPPEVAMRMLRDQGGPAPFEGGRNGRSGHQLGGPSPIIAMPPALRQDPRNLRRLVSCLCKIS